MGKLKSHRQVTIYMDPELYEQTRCSAYTLDENIYQFVSEALTSAIKRRLTKEQRDAIELMSKQNVKNGGGGSRRRSRHNPTL